MTLIIVIIILGASIFTVVPVTQYVYLNDTVTFECATNLTGYHLLVLTNASIAISLQSVSLSNGGEMVSLNLTAKSEANGTAVTCFIFNMMFHHNMYNTTEPAYVYIQGKYNNYIH